MTQAACSLFLSAKPNASACMAAAKKVGLAASVFLIASLAGCADQAPDAKMDTIGFSSVTNPAYFFVEYQNPDDIPWFTDNFRASIDGEYVGDINRHEVMQAPVREGDHYYKVKIYAWYGDLRKEYNLHAATYGGPVYIKISVGENDKATKLIAVDASEGQPKVANLKKICGC